MIKIGQWNSYSKVYNKWIPDSSAHVRKGLSSK